MAAQKKGDIVADIAGMLGIPPPSMSTGSTEPRTIFTAVNSELGLGLDPDATKEELARGIVEASGHPWHPDYESRGATITKRGLLAVQRAVQFFLGIEDTPPRGGGLA